MKSFRRSGYIFPIGTVLSIGYLLQSGVFDSYHVRSKETETGIIEARDYSREVQEPFRCIRTKLLLDKYRTTVCVHRVADDTDVSGLLIHSGIWEEESVTRIIRILASRPSLAFFDIGANLGVYSMYAAAAGCATIFVLECFRPNVERIRRAMELEHVEKQMLIVPYALYKESNVYLRLIPNILGNIGSQRLSRKVLRNDSNSMVVQTIRFDDLLVNVTERGAREAIIKIDIETSEHFLCKTGQRMFDRINIPFIMMEWALIKEIPSRAKPVHDFFTRRSYTAYNPSTCQPQADQHDYQQWNDQDIYWIKEKYESFCDL